jgi:hypothetical protein
VQGFPAQAFPAQAFLVPAFLAPLCLAQASQGKRPKIRLRLRIPQRSGL